jgi:hypothetical protein
MFTGVKLFDIRGGIVVTSLVRAPRLPSDNAIAAARLAAYAAVPRS